MKPRHPLDHISAVVGAFTGAVSVVGAVILLWGSQDAMTVVIHWIGEEKVLGSQNVILQPNGSKLLTNPGVMAKFVVTIWVVGISQVMAGGFLFWKSTKKWFARSAAQPPEVTGE